MPNAMSRVICAISSVMGIIVAEEKLVWLRIVIADPVMKSRPDRATGIQNDLPTSRCLIVLWVFKLSMLMMAAIAAIATSRMGIMVCLRVRLGVFASWGKSLVNALLVFQI